MVVKTKTASRYYGKNHASSADALNDWFNITLKGKLAKSG